MRRGIAILICVCMLSACEDFLMEDPRSLATPDEFFTEASSAQSSVDAIYSHLTGDGVYAKDMWRLHAMFSDNGYQNGADPDMQELSNFNVTAENALVANIWRGLYAGINTCNFAINGIPTSPVSEAEQLPLIAEARFFRGLFYFELVRCFGGVPLITVAPITVDDAFKAERASIDSVYNLVIDDLLYARENLPRTALNGRPTILVASAYLGKVYADRGEMTLAFPLTRGVILSNQFSLQSDFDLNFQVGNKINSEVMLSAPLSEQSSGNVNTRSLPPQLNGTSLELPTEDLVAQFDIADLRFPVTILTEVTEPDSTVSQIAPHISKYWDQHGEPEGGPTAVNYPILRYSDVLLLHAEIVATLNNGPTTEAYFVINQVRTRAGLPGLTGLNLQAFIEAVLAERRRELGWEGYRWYDLKRLAVLEERVKAAKPEVDVQAKHYLLPIPAQELVLNPLLEQNPGY